MKVGIIGAGNVGKGCALALMLRGACDEIVLIDRDEELATGVGTDLSHGALLCETRVVRAGRYDDLEDAALVIVTAGRNEKAGGAAERGDSEGRLRLLPHNARVFGDIIPGVARIAPEVPVLVVTDPPDALTDVARKLTKTNPLVSAGTYLDSLRFRLHVARCLNVPVESVDGQVLGEHGASAVAVWSACRVDCAMTRAYAEL